MCDALRATSWEALGEQAAPKATPRAQTSMISLSCRIAVLPSDAAPDDSCLVRVNLRSEPLGGVVRHRHLELEPEEDFDHVRVELRARALAQPAARFLAAQPLAVGAVGRHRVERVADEDDPRLERDLIAGLAVRVARAVPALVAAADDRAHLGEPFDRLQDPLAELRVHLHDRTLFR